MKVEIAYNTVKKGVEISFSEKPKPIHRTFLKGMGYAYSPKGYWWKKGTDKDRETIIKRFQKKDFALPETQSVDLHGVPKLTLTERRSMGEPEGQLKGFEDVYKLVTQRVIKEMEKWTGKETTETWSSSKGYTGHPLNFMTKNPYRGVNSAVLKLCQGPTGHGWWMTRKQIEKKGGKLKKGALPAPIVYFTMFDRKTEVERDGKKEEVEMKTPALMHYQVFNAEDIEGIDFGITEAEKRTDAERIDIADRMVTHYLKKQGGPTLRHGGDRAFFRPSEDLVQMPLIEQFKTDQYYYATLFHELIHSTGASHRLDREKGKKFGDKKYAFEELVAELGGAMLSANAGILNHHIQPTGQYLKNWLQALKNDNKFIFEAAAKAQAGADYMIKGFDFKAKPKPSKTKAPVNRRPSVKKTKGPQKASKRALKTGEQTSLFGLGFVPADVLAEKHYEMMQLKEPWNSIIGRPAKNFDMMVWGLQQSGKTTLLLQFADYFAKNHGTVGYVSKEEHDTATLQEKINRHLSPEAKKKIGFAKQIPANGDFTGFDLIILDSVTDLRLGIEDYKALREQNPDTAFIVVVQCTKNGTFRGSQEWPHEVEICGKIEQQGVIEIYRNRYNQLSKYNFFTGEFVKEAAS